MTYTLEGHPFVAFAVMGCALVFVVSFCGAFYSILQVIAKVPTISNQARSDAVNRFFAGKFEFRLLRRCIFVAYAGAFGSFVAILVLLAAFGKRIG
jgi:hypothetical protein